MSNSWFDTLGVFDLETTGIDVETSRIVSAHVGVLNAAGDLVEEWNWLANPGVEIPAGASDVHGITTERARAEGRPAAEVIAEIIDVLTSLFNRGLAVTIYNAPYDLSLLHNEALRYNLAPLIEPAPIIDPLVLDRVVDRWRKGKRTLEAAAVVYGVDLVDAHDVGMLERNAQLALAAEELAFVVVAGAAVASPQNLDGEELDRRAHV